MNDKIPEFYKLDAECTNCNFSKKGFDIPKGAKLEEQECPDCRNKGTLVKSIQTSSYYNFGNNGWNF